MQTASELKSERATSVRLKRGWMERRKRAREDSASMNRLRQGVFLLEQEHDAFLVSSNLKQGYNPLKPYINLVLGALFSFISILWMVHIVVFMLFKGADGAVGGPNKIL